MKLTPCILLLMFFCSCGRREKSATVKDDQLSVQAISVTEKDATISYKVRIFPDQKWKDKSNSQLGEKMRYHVDSCFYLLQDNVSYYPESIMPIANGMSTNFEYLISFGPLPKEGSVERQLIYHDKYMSQKDYKLLLK